MDAKNEIRIFEKQGVNNTRAVQIRAFLDGLRTIYNRGELEFAPSTRVGARIARELSKGQSVPDTIDYCIAAGMKPLHATMVRDEAKKTFRN
jgi:hypothetical protein